MPDRCFIAIPVPRNVRVRLRSIQEELATYGTQRPVAPEQMHITLSFLGNVRSEDKNQAADTIHSLSEDPVPCSINKIGYFPGKDYIQVVWVGVSSSNNRLSSIADHVRDQLETIREDNNTFTPHITLSRVSSLTKEEREQLRETAQNMDIGNIEFTAEKVTLYKSQQSKQRHQHIPVATNELQEQ